MDSSSSRCTRSPYTFQFTGKRLAVLLDQKIAVLRDTFAVNHALPPAAVREIHTREPFVAEEIAIQQHAGRLGVAMDIQDGPHVPRPFPPGSGGSVCLISLAVLALEVKLYVSRYTVILHGGLKE